MKYILTLSLILFLSTTAYCQNTGLIKGVVHDSLSKIALEAATVSVFNEDSTLLNYQLTDMNGNFSITKIPLKKNVRLNITYTGYKSFDKNIKLDVTTADSVNVFLVPGYSDTNAVVVKSYIPVRMNGDTLEINPAAFKMKPNAVVEELLNEVPGVTIWSDGTITVNGRKVPKILVDGKPFMGQNDARIATQNLPKSAIDKIQVYSQVDRTKQQQNENAPKDSILTMNIKLKEDAKKGYFGKATFGYGTDNRYESNLSFQVYNKKSSLGIGGGLNNINKNISNLQDMFKGNTYRNYNPNLYDVGNFDNGGINKNYSIGAIATHNFIQSTDDRQIDRITANYNFSGNNNFTVNQSLQNRTTKASPQIIESNSENNGTQTSHVMGMNYAKSNGWRDNLNVSVNSTFNRNSGDNSSFTSVLDTNRVLLSTNSTNSHTNGKSNNETVNVDFSRFDWDNPLMVFWSNARFNATNDVTDRMEKSIFKSKVDSTQNTTYNRLYHTDNNNTSLSANINYMGFKRLLFGRFNLYGIDLRFNQTVDYKKNKTRNNVFDYDSATNRYLKNTNLSNENLNENFTFTPSISIGKTYYKWLEGFNRYLYFNVSLNDEITNDKNTSSLNYRNLSRNFNFLTQNALIYYDNNKQNDREIRANISYSRNTSYPTIDQLHPIIDSINIYNLQIGNPNLKNTNNNRTNFELNYTKQKPKSKIDFNTGVNGGYNWYKNPISDSTVNDSSGRRTLYWVNVDSKQDFNLNYYFNISKKLKENTLQLRYNLSYSHSASPNYIDGIYTNTKSNTTTHSVNLQFAVKSLLILTLEENISTYKSKQSNNNLSSFGTNSHSTKFGTELNYSKNLSFGNTISVTKNSNLSNAVVLWNAFAGYRFLKNEQAEIKFSALDILKQFKNINNTANFDGTTTTVTNGLRQYFMFTLSYFPRKIGKREIKQN